MVSPLLNPLQFLSTDDLARKYSGRREFCSCNLFVACDLVESVSDFGVVFTICQEISILNIFKMLVKMVGASVFFRPFMPFSLLEYTSNCPKLLNKKVNVLFLLFFSFSV